MSCFYCNRTNTESPEGNAVLVVLGQGFVKLASAHNHFWKLPNEPQTYRPEWHFSGAFQDGLGGTVSIDRYVAAAGPSG